jgi:hypothetical protein
MAPLAFVRGGLTRPAIDPQDTDFAGAAAVPFTFRWGWPGPLFSSVFPPVLVRLLEGRPALARWPMTLPQREETKRHP